MWEKLVRDIKINLLSSNLMPLKFLFFMLYAANTTLYPYLAVHLQSLGFGADEAAVLYAIIPIVSMMGPPIAGAIADKLGNFKLFFSGMVAVSGTISLLLLIIPVVPIPPGLSLTLLTDHHEGQDSISFLAETLPREETGQVVDAEYLQFIVITNQTGCDIYDEYQTTMDGLLKINIGHAEPKSTANLTLIHKKDSSNFSLLAVTTHHPLFCPHNVPLRKLSKGSEVLLPEILKDYNTTALNKTINGSLAIEDQSAWWRSGCEIKVPGLCDPHHADIIGAEAKSFWTYLFARTLLNTAMNAGFTLFEGATLSLLKEHEGDYGLQKMWGYVGSAVFTPISGWLMDTLSFDTNSPDFRPAFYLFVGLQGLAGLVALSVDLKFKTPNKNVMKNIWAFLHNPEVIMLFLAMCFAGAFYGFLEAFLFWFLGDLGASRSLMGLTVSVGASAAIPFLIFMSPIIRKFGHIAVIAAGFLMYAIRFAGYASIYDPVNALYFEALEGVTIGLMLSAGMTYAGHLSTTKNVVSLQAISGTLHHGVGKGAGSLVGGYMYHHLGARMTFRLMTVASALSAIIFFIFHIYIRHRNRLRALKRLEEEEELLTPEDVAHIKLTGVDAEGGKRKSIAFDVCHKPGFFLVEMGTQTDPVHIIYALSMAEDEVAIEKDTQTEEINFEVKQKDEGKKEEDEERNIEMKTKKKEERGEEGEEEEEEEEEEEGENEDNEDKEEENEL